jgi:hypothetical protein
MLALAVVAISPEGGTYLAQVCLSSFQASAGRGSIPRASCNPGKHEGPFAWVPGKLWTLAFAGMNSARGFNPKLLFFG